MIAANIQVLHSNKSSLTRGHIQGNQTISETLQRYNRKLAKVDKEVLNFYAMNGSLAARTREPLSSQLAQQVNATT